MLGLFYMLLYFFFFKATSTTEISTYGHTLSLHAALPILSPLFLSGSSASQSLAEPRFENGLYAWRSCKARRVTMLNSRTVLSLAAAAVAAAGFAALPHVASPALAADEAPEAIAIDWAHYNPVAILLKNKGYPAEGEIGRAPGRERGRQYV